MTQDEIDRQVALTSWAHLGFRLAWWSSFVSLWGSPDDDDDDDDGWGYDAG